MTDAPIITPHPDVESLSNSDFLDALTDADERLETLHKLPSEDSDPLIQPWLVQERMLILAEINRRNPDKQATGAKKERTPITVRKRI